MKDFVTYEIELPAKILAKLTYIAKTYNCSVDDLIAKLIDECYEAKKIRR